MIKDIIKRNPCYLGDVGGSTATVILDLARRHSITYQPTSEDAWANHVTRLADDEIELLLGELARSGHLSGPDAARLQVNYLREAKVKV